MKTINLTKRGYKNRNTARVSACQYIKKNGLKNVTKNYTEKDGKIFVELVINEAQSTIDENPYQIDTKPDFESVLRPIINFIENIKYCQNELGPKPTDTHSTEWQEWVRDSNELIECRYDDGFGEIYKLGEALQKLIPNWDDKQNLIPSIDHTSTLGEIRILHNDDPTELKWWDCESVFPKMESVDNQEKLIRTINENCIGDDNDIFRLSLEELDQKRVAIRKEEERRRILMEDKGIPF